MYISIESLLVILLIGLVAGWLASKIVEGAGIGLIVDTAIVIACAFSGSWIMPRSGIDIGSGLVSSTVVATIGAVFLLVVMKLIGGGFPRRRRLGSPTVIGH